MDMDPFYALCKSGFMASFEPKNPYSCGNPIQLMTCIFTSMYSLLQITDDIGLRWLLVLWYITTNFEDYCTVSIEVHDISRVLFCSHRLYSRTNNNVVVSERTGRNWGLRGGLDY